MVRGVTARDTRRLWSLRARRHLERIVFAFRRRAHASACACPRRLKPPLYAESKSGLALHNAFFPGPLPQASATLRTQNALPIVVAFLEWRGTTRRRYFTMKTIFVLAAALTLAAITVNAQQSARRVVQPITNKEWITPFPGFKIVGNVYYVGTYDLAAYLITTNEGHILINTGADGSYDLMKPSIESLGFKISDIKIITSTHGHRDHVGDIARFQKESG